MSYPHEIGEVLYEMMYSPPPPYHGYGEFKNQGFTLGLRRWKAWQSVEIE